ncbi:hypothetical protein [Virgibacillus sp. CBA3643]|uniref:hypothetical protein n=1 Tax=Virgibacillus sp. CBA3643 TaxID=2942278 RepID=UPI0035A27B8D
MTDKGGRPEKLTPEIEQEIIKVVRSGNYVETACAYVGINKTTFYDWLKRGAREKDRLAKNHKARMKKDEKKYVEFSNAIEKALAYAEIRDVAIIGQAAEDNWTAAAWRLERKFPDKWGRKDKQSIEHSGKDGGAIETSHKQQLDLSNLTDEELAQLEDIIGKHTDTEGDTD